jgi:YgiT-type zinc finger domain-containing protein
MKCLLCKGEMQDKYTTFMTELDDSIVIVKKVPTQVCEQCGEETYTAEVAEQLERIVAASRLAITEIAIVSYSDNVA